jgi:hypothetical protein
MPLQAACRLARRGGEVICVNFDAFTVIFLAYFNAVFLAKIC